MALGLEALQSAVSAMADGALVADTRSGAVFVNRAAREMLGIPQDLEIDTTYLKDVVGFYPFDLAATAAENQPVREEVRIGDRVLHSVVTPLFDAGQLTGAIVVLRDLGDTADVARRRAEFAQVMSHELRTPLTSIAGALDIVLSGYAGSLSDRQLRYVDMARQAATRMNQLVDQLLDLARSQAGTITVASAPVQLDRLAREVIDRYRAAAATKQLTIVLGASADDIAILGDPERLSQVLGNLITNAIRFAPTGGVIDVQVFGPPLSEDAVGVSVHNTGDPIPPEDHERVFEPFSASSRRVGGTALGLSISRTIIEAHGGRIWVESGADGTKFVFTLPVSASKADATPPPLDDKPRRRGLGEGACALVADDDPRRALLLKGLLMSLTDRVLVANDVDSALATARLEHPALTVVAGAMTDALALLAILEHDPDTQRSAVMVVGEAERRADLLSAGADDLVEFPIQPANFRDACLRLVDSGRREAPRVLIVDDDPSIRLICREVLELGGYQVRDAGSANAALAEARRFRPDMIVLDVLMPGIDGYRCAELIRADPAIGMAPIMFLSARGDTADKVRAFRSGAEDYMVKPFDAAELLARVGKALDRQARELGASPTTQLPGADAIQAEIERRLRENDSLQHAVACYLDLDNLKAFNDYYGYAKANAVIRQTGDVIRHVVTNLGCPGDFIGHIAGDDFVFITTADRADAVCRGICERFDHLIRLYYDPADRAAGYIETKDRFGVQRRFPIMSVSIAAISLARAKTYAGLAELAATGKRTAKAISGSTYVRDGQTVLAAVAS